MTSGYGRSVRFKVECHCSLKRHPPLSPLGCQARALLVERGGHATWEPSLEQRLLDSVCTSLLDWGSAQASRLCFRPA